VKESVSIEEKINRASIAIDNNDLNLAKELIDQIEQDILSFEKNFYTIQLIANLGGLMIDYGSSVDNFGIIEKGTRFIKEIFSIFPEDKLSVSHFYNLANGYSAMRSIQQPKTYLKGVVSKYYVNAKKAYRKALDLVATKVLDTNELRIRPDLFTNYGNMLDSIGRPVEALGFYNRALAITPNKPETLVTKAILLQSLALKAIGHSHLFILEAKRLLDFACINSPPAQLEKHIAIHINSITEFIEAHGGEISIEQYQISKPVSKFHKFLRDFCFQHELYLTPTTLIGKEEHQFFCDPLFISNMKSDIQDTKKFDRYITFFNQIKQDYIFSRFLLVQSQYKAQYAEVIDRDVDYYYPLDYSLYSSYIEMLKVSYRLVVDTLDKIAFFVKDYCGIKSLSTRDTNFRNVFSTKNNPLELRSELKQFKNIYLFGLLDLALDMRKGEYYEFVYDLRNAVTHRFVSIHSEIILEKDKDVSVPNRNLDQFTNATIQVLQLLKAAITYLVLFVDSYENNQTSSGIVMPIVLTKADGVLRWKPSMGDDNA